MALIYMIMGHLQKWVHFVMGMKEHLVAAAPDLQVSYDF